jgi:hypothetical protein
MLIFQVSSNGSGGENRDGCSKQAASQRSRTHWDTAQSTTPRFGASPLRSSAPASCLRTTVLTRIGRYESAAVDERRPYHYRPLHAQLAPLWNYRFHLGMRADRCGPRHVGELISSRTVALADDRIFLCVHCLPAAVAVSEDICEDGAVGIVIDDSVRDCDVAIEADIELFESRLAIRRTGMLHRSVDVLPFG